MANRDPDTQEAIAMAQSHINGLLELGYLEKRRREIVNEMISESATAACQVFGIDRNSDRFEEVVMVLTIHNGM